MTSPRQRGQRAGLTRTMVLSAARDLIGTRGLTGLSMRAIAAQLGVAPNAVYSYVENKGALVDELLDDALAGVRPPDDPLDDPVDGLRQVMARTFEMLLEQRDLVPLYLARQGSRGPHARHLGEIMHEQLAAVGVPAGSRQNAVRVLIVYTIGFAAFTIQPPDGTPAGPLGDSQLAADFANGLNWLLDGITDRRR